ncbi:hypothetical protein BsWGS_18205 [Bradybaena similaris]
MDLSVEESIDFDFFDERPQRERQHVTQPVSAMKPPLPPDPTKQLPKSDNFAKGNQHGDSVREAGSSSGSDSSRDTSPECSSRSASEEDVSRSSDTSRINAVKSQNSHSRPSSASSAGSSVDSDSASTDSEQTDSYGSQSKSKTSDVGRGKDLQSATDSRKPPTNPLAESREQTKRNKDRHQLNSEYGSKIYLDNNGRKLGNTVSYQKGNKYPDEASGNRDTKQAWHEVKGPKGKKEISIVLRRSKTNRDRPKTAVERSDAHSSKAQHHRSHLESDSNSDSDITDTKEVWHEVNGTKGKKQMSIVLRRSKTNIDRPKTAVTRSDKHSVKTQPHRSRSESDSNSDSDITDVSSIETPSNEIEDRYKQKIGEGARMTDAGDGHPVKLQLKPVSYDDEKDSAVNYDPDKITGFDLKLLMKAVGELEKQNKVQMNSRRVMFAPATLKGSEKSNYTFDKNQTRDIERENHRLLKEIIRHVSSGEQKRHFNRQPGPYRLTPSAVNRERDIQRIERENLAFLKRLQDVKPTKSICRDNQLRAYESTVFCGVPIAALQHKPNGKRVRSLAIDSADTSVGGRAESASSISSIGSSVRSMGSGRSSRPTSAKSGFSVKRIDSRPAWTDRW